MKSDGIVKYKQYYIIVSLYFLFNAFCYLEYIMESIIIFLILFAMVVYFLPIIVAFIRKNNNCLAIFILNLFLGWTFVGWVIALVWACTNTQINRQ